MKKKIINGLLFAVALVAATSSFVSCKLVRITKVTTMLN